MWTQREYDEEELDRLERQLADVIDARLNRRTRRSEIGDAYERSLRTQIAELRARLGGRSGE
jgi:hypothetical protein